MADFSNTRTFDPSKVTLEADEQAFIQRYDARCKRILSNRMVLAHLLHHTMQEFADIEPERIASQYIEGVPGQHNYSLNIQGMRNERNDPNRTANFFDILFYALLPNTNQSIPVIINVEPQADYSPGYDLLNRALFYAGCIIADQKNSVFDKDNYDDLRKVCSIWICLEPPKYLANTISSYSLEQHNLLGVCPPHPIDKLQLVLVRVGTEDHLNYTGIMPLLDACLSKKTNQIKQNHTTQQYNVTLSPEDTDMTAGEQLIYKYKREIWEAKEQAKEQAEIAGREARIEGRKEGKIEGRKEGKIEGRKEGKIEGRKEGKIEGRKEGKIEGRKEGKIETASNLLKLGISPELIAQATGLSATEIDDLRKAMT
ncbi:MAG: hypothetical protein IJ165_10450 [Proteobacteria bacterium]|nr:hypothetical protein [Pseudomonadota bacterium]